MSMLRFVSVTAVAMMACVEWARVSTVLAPPRGSSLLPRRALDAPLPSAVDDEVDFSHEGGNLNVDGVDGATATGHPRTLGQEIPLGRGSA